MMATGPVNTVKAAEGDKFVAEAEKCLKTNWLKWSADYDGAAHAFDKAGLCYRNAKDYDKARKAYERAADAYDKIHALFNAGKSMEQAASICKEMGDIELCARCLERASSLYHESGHPDTAGQVLRRAAKMVEATLPAKAAQYYLSTADLHESEEKYRDAVSAVRSAVNMYTRIRDFDSLLGSLYKLKNLYELTNQYKNLYEAAAIEVVVHLHRGDLPAATDTLTGASVEMRGFSNSDAAPLLGTLLTAYQEGDEEAVHKACDDVLFRTMDNEVAKLARDLKNKVIPSGAVEDEMLGSSSLVNDGMIGATALATEQSPVANITEPQDADHGDDDDQYSAIN